MFTHRGMMSQASNSSRRPTHKKSFFFRTSTWSQQIFKWYTFSDPQLFDFFDRIKRYDNLGVLVDSTYIDWVVWSRLTVTRLAVMC
jgi:hypothetical protein